MSHPQPSLTQRQFSPPQASSPSPINAATAGGFSLPPSKRPKVSPGVPHSQPNSPYANSTPYAPSPPSGAATPTTSTGLPSPALPVNMVATTTTQVPQSSYNSSHQPNGRFASIGQAQATHAAQAAQTAQAHSSMSTQIHSPMPTPSQPPAQPLPQYSRPPNQASTPTVTHTPPINHTSSQYSNATLAPMSTSAPMPATGNTGNMGPPAIYPSSSFSAANDITRQNPRPAPSTSKTTSYEMNDMLMGTGIDLEEEAEYMNNLETRTGFPHLPAGGRDSLYGAGPANQPTEPTDAKTQEELAALAADRAWNEAAHRLAVTRSQEIRQHLLEPGIVHRRLYEVASKFGLGLNLDIKPDGRSQYIGKFAAPAEFPKPELKISYRPGPDGNAAMIKTCGSFIPKESFLVDQIALLSIGTKERLRDLLSDANKIAVTRQKSSHGTIPSEWVDAAVPQSPKVNGLHAEGTRTGAESAVSPRTNPLKRPLDEISNNGLPTPVSEAPPPNYLIESLLEVGKQSQNQEEGRLRKRQKRLEKLAEKDKEGAEAGSRSGSVAPGTPGSVAPEGGDSKTLSKKEGKKAAAKAAESSSGTTVNATLSLFTGGKKKKYSWMNSGAGSGASTPRAQSNNNSGAAGGTGGTPTSKAGRGPLTKASVTHLGQFREDSEKGKNIQLRDWVVVLEDRGMDPKSLQTAYDKIDKSHTGDKVITEKA
ncbi:hypothetical protein HD806DRAFT_509985 [Xylariaceae sp. AK1471]|nr:hypothetical protein HD806DRAFT_509985 [Xylariaceae sp. AK1471]